MNCPICPHQGRNLTPPSYEGAVIDCPRCGSFRIMPAALDKLNKLGIDHGPPKSQNVWISQDVADNY